MRARLAGLLILVSGAASAEPTAISRLRPTDERVCKLEQEIVIVRCEIGTAVFCEVPGAAMHYSCAEGAPQRALPAPAAMPAPAATSPPKALSRKPAAHRHVKRFRRQRNQSLFDLLSKTFRP